MNFFGFKERGQVHAVDVIVAIILFAMVFFALKGIMENNLLSVQSDAQYFSMQLSAQQALNCLLNTKGYPLLWDANNVELIGLMQTENVLDSQKVNAFQLMSYATAKEKLALEAYDFSFDLNACCSVPGKHIGSYPTSLDQIVSIKRDVIYMGVKSSVVFKVFRK